MEETKKSLLYIHLAVLLFGLAGLFGKFLYLSSNIIVLGRTTFAALFLIIFLRYKKQNIKLRERSTYFALVRLGFLLAIHWVTFFKSIKESTVAIGLLSFSTFPVFTTFLEPILFKENIKFRSIMNSLITFSGILLVIPKFEMGNNITQGVIWGVISGLSFALLSILNRKFVQDYSALVIAFYQNMIACLVLIPFLFTQNPKFTLANILLLILLGVLFTAVAHSLFIKGLAKIKAQTASIITCLEPVYGTLFAIILLNEIPNLRVILGGSIILSTAFYSTIHVKKK